MAYFCLLFFSSRRRHTRCALVTGVQTCALPISLIAPLLTGWMAAHFTDTPLEQNYRLVFVTAGVGMLLSLLWFWFGRRQLKGVGRPASGAEIGRAHV